MLHGSQAISLIKTPFMKDFVQHQGEWRSVGSTRGVGEGAPATTSGEPPRSKKTNMKQRSQAHDPRHAPYPAHHFECPALGRCHLCSLVRQPPGCHHKPTSWRAPHAQSSQALTSRHQQARGTESSLQIFPTRLRIWLLVVSALSRALSCDRRRL